MTADNVSLPPGIPLPGIVQTLAGLLWMDRFERYLQRGPRMRTMKVLGMGKVVTVHDPAALEQLFTGDPDVVQAADINTRLFRSIGPDSVMRLDGERHLRMRRLLLPPFHGEAMKAYEDLFEEVTSEEIGDWPEGKEFAVHPAMQRIALESILRAVLGVSEGERGDRLRAVLPRVLQANPLTFLLEGRFPWSSRGALGRMQPWVRARHEARALIAEEVAAHRAEPDGRDDVLAMLIAARDADGEGLTDSELEDQLITLLLAGHETTASTLAFCFERLVRHPRVLERLTEEIRAGEQTRYLEAVLDETQRVRPVVEVTWRVLAQSMEIGGYSLPAGTIVLPAIRGVHSSDLWEDAEEFRPERFLEAKPSPYSLIPFGGGPRRCLGASFARLEMKAVLRTVLGRYDLATTDRRAERRDRTRRFSTVPGNGGRVTVFARSASIPP